MTRTKQENVNILLLIAKENEISNTGVIWMTSCEQTFSSYSNLVDPILFCCLMSFNAISQNFSKHFWVEGIWTHCVKLLEIRI